MLRRRAVGYLVVALLFSGCGKDDKAATPRNPVAAGSEEPRTSEKPPAAQEAPPAQEASAAKATTAAELARSPAPRRLAPTPSGLPQSRLPAFQPPPCAPVA